MYGRGTKENDPSSGIDLGDVKGFDSTVNAEAADYVEIRGYRLVVSCHRPTESITARNQP
jgi:hypothetical protein